MKPSTGIQLKTIDATTAPRKTSGLTSPSLAKIVVL